MMLTHSYTSPIVPQSQPPCCRRSAARIARHRAIMARGITGRSEYIQERIRKIAARRRSTNIARRRTYPTYFVIEDHISLHRRHKLGETVDEFACSGSDG